MNVVLLHGWGLTPAVWNPLVDALALQGVAGMSCPALTAPVGSLQEWADAMIAASTIPHGSVLIGWSLGAMLSLAIAAHHPQYVARLVLIAATPSFVARTDWPHGLDPETTRAFREGFQRDPSRTLERFVALQALGDSNRSEVATALRTCIADPSVHRAALSHGLRMLDESDLRNDLPPVSMRCLLVHGARDALIPASASEWLAHRWSRSESCVLPDCGHAPFLSRTHAVARRIKEFIDAA